jgi:hypothetical protein
MTHCILGLLQNLLTLKLIPSEQMFRNFLACSDGRSLRTLRTGVFCGWSLCLLEIPILKMAASTHAERGILRGREARNHREGREGKGGVKSRGEESIGQQRRGEENVPMCSQVDILFNFNFDSLYIINMQGFPCDNSIHV